MKTERFELKISKADKQALKEAAKAAGLSMGGYVVAAAMAVRITPAKPAARKGRRGL